MGCRTPAACKSSGMLLEKAKASLHQVAVQSKDFCPTTASVFTQKRKPLNYLISHHSCLDTPALPVATGQREPITFEAVQRIHQIKLLPGVRTRAARAAQKTAVSGGKSACALRARQTPGCLLHYKVNMAVSLFPEPWHGRSVP